MGDPIRPVQDAVRAAVGDAGAGLVAVACSGGADSIALADAAIEVAGAPRVAVLTIDHGLSEGSARIAAEVAAWARGRGAAAASERVTVPRRASIEAAARQVRYDALERLAAGLGAARVLVGHTARDQAETVLLRLVRGTGPAGLAGIPAVRGRFVRPLLALGRDAIEAYVAARALPTWDDPMNEDLRLARVRVRRELLPRLRRENPRLDAALVRLAGSAAEWQEVIDGLAAPHARLPVACADLAALPAAVRKRAVALALDRAGIDHDAAHLDAIDRLVTRPPHGTIRIDLPAARIVRTYDRLELERARVVAPPPAGPADLAPPPGPYLLRTWQRGDRMKPARLKGRSRKLSDLYIDAKVPHAARAAARVLVRTTTGAIVWAEHLGLAHGESTELVPAGSGGAF
ncbi:MAG TPA: tRNA lysidine(34) synthetase TilS [Kofleriaceae bacterium]|nr:tRNA lysidine(34) synthetase TilS [Kofleriaceae bacterium]